MSIEGITLSPEEQALVDYVHQERMSHDEGVQYGINWLRKHGVIPGPNNAE